MSDHRRFNQFNDSYGSRRFESNARLPGHSLGYHHHSGGGGGGGGHSAGGGGGGGTMSLDAFMFMANRRASRSIDDNELTPALLRALVSEGQNFDSEAESEAADEVEASDTFDDTKGVTAAAMIALNDCMRRREQTRIFDDEATTRAYRRVPLLERVALPRGGIVVETQSSIGRIQFGIPPETIKDSMRLGLDVPRIYIVPVERFCREMGPALGINLAEFEFPAYFNYFVRKKKCILVVDSEDAERNIRTVFEETLLGPREFRDKYEAKANDPEDYDPSYPVECRPNFMREFGNFRKAEKTADYDELEIDMLVDFCHFDDEHDPDDSRNQGIGVPRIVEDEMEDMQRSSAFQATTANFDFCFQYCSRSDSALHTVIADPSTWMVPGTEDDDADDRPNNSQQQQQRRLSAADVNYSPVSPPAEQRIMNRAEWRRRSSVASSLELPLSDCGSSEGDDDSEEDEIDDVQWLYSMVKWLGKAATLWPADATPQQIAARSVPRVEIFKMPGGTDYVIHEVDEHNYITGKARLNGTVKVPDEIAVEGFQTDAAMSEHADTTIHTTTTSCSGPMIDRPIRHARLSTFHPPSFGVTILGNSHGFDKNGATSGYVIWINGRGVMVDPPPYSSATLEREGIRPQTIIAIIITHCHADHDAGAFQKVLTGSRVAVITAPSTYKSFIRKYSALSGLSAKFLKHSHRYIPAIVGRPLRFQGATFHFNFSLHTIPCINVKVEWRGRSIVFTGDHLNLPPYIQKLENEGVLTKERADVLRNLPLQECDVLLHEAGAPPIHTPLKVLQELPQHVKDRLYVVHTSALPPDCGLRVAPCGTVGTIRLDGSAAEGGVPTNGNKNPQFISSQGILVRKDQQTWSSSDMVASLDDGGDKNVSVLGSFSVPSQQDLLKAGFGGDQIAPLVFQRPTCVSDAWFILNLLSNVPFFSSLSYMNTMDVLEISRVQVLCSGQVVVEAQRRMEVLCVVWEGVCMEKLQDNSITSHQHNNSSPLAVWYAGDWIGPVSLQPNASRLDHHRDIVAVSKVGVKVIIIQMADLHKILKRGSKPYRKYLSLEERRASQVAGGGGARIRRAGEIPSFTHDHVLDVLRCNSVLGSLPALQQRALESIAEGPRTFEAGSPLWRLGDRCDYSFLIVSGTVTIDPNASAKAAGGRPGRRQQRKNSVGTVRSMIDLGGGECLQADKIVHHVPPDSEYARLERLLAVRADEHMGVVFEDDSRHQTYQQSSLLLLGEEDQQMAAENRFMNKVLGRLYSGRKFTAGVKFGRGCFLSDTSRMVSGELLQDSGDAQNLHSSTMQTGPHGCVALVFTRAQLLPFLDANPGILLSLLGTQVVV